MALRNGFLALLLHSTVALADTTAFWTVTERYARFATASPYTYNDGDVTLYTTTEWRTVKPTITPSATPTSVISTFSRYSNLEVVSAFYPVGAVQESDLTPESNYDDYYSSMYSTTSTAMYFSMPVTLTAPESCPTRFTVTPTVSVTVPTEVTDQLKPRSTTTGSVSTGRYGGVYVTQTWWLTAGAAPYTSSNDFTYTAYVQSCRTPPSSYPTSTSTGGSSSGSSNDDIYDGRYCNYYYYSCGTPFRVYIIVIATVIPGLFLLGFLESYFWFRRLMTGRSAIRLGTICWVFISLWILCFSRMQDKRSPEDQKLLTQRWKEMGSGAAFKAWLKWGFRRKYPEPLLGQFSSQTVGIVPPGQPLHTPMTGIAPPQLGFQQNGPGAPPQGMPAMQQGQPMYYYGPPPPGWVQGPDGAYVPPQGYVYPAPVHFDAAKNGSVVSSAPSAAPEQPMQHAVSPAVTPQQGHVVPLPHGANVPAGNTQYTPVTPEAPVGHAVHHQPRAGVSEVPDTSASHVSSGIAAPATSTGTGGGGGGGGGGGA